MPLTPESAGGIGTEAARTGDPAKSAQEGDVPNKSAGGMEMGIIIKPSDLKYRYPRDTVNRDLPKFSRLPDPTPFNRNDLYEVVPMMAAVMDTLQCDEQRVLHLVEDILNSGTPLFIRSREEIFSYLVGMARDQLGRGQTE